MGKGRDGCNREGKGEVGKGRENQDNIYRKTRDKDTTTNS